MNVIKPFLHPCNLFDELAFKENLAKSSFRNLGNLQELLKSTNQLNLPEKGIWRQQIWNRKDLERLTKRVNKSMLMYYANQPYANIITNQCFCNSYVISSSLHPCEVGRKSFKLSQIRGWVLALFYKLIFFICFIWLMIVINCMQCSYWQRCRHSLRSI